MRAAPDHGHLRVGAVRHRRRGLLLLAAAGFQFWLWVTRIVNLVRDAGDFPVGFVVVHLVLYVAAIGVGVMLAVIGFRMWREARHARDSGPSS